MSDDQVPVDQPEGLVVRGQEWVPEFEGQRPPFQPGNQAGLRHGAFSPRYVDPATDELLEAMLADEALPAHARAGVYRMELRALCRATVQAEMVSKSLAEHLELAGGDVVKALRADGVAQAFLVLHRAEARAATARSRLGLTPVAAARLGKNVAQGQAASVDVALRMAQLHELEAQGWRPPDGWRPEGQGAAGE